MSGYVGADKKPIALYDSYTQAQANALLSNKADAPAVTFASGSAVFTNSTNNIALTEIGSIGLEVGDVVQVTGTASNNKLFAVEVITDSGNVIVNQAHAGGTTTKSLVNETVSATVTLVTKWFNAPLGLGQGWADVIAARATGVVYTNGTSRAMSIFTKGEGETGGIIEVDGNFFNWQAITASNEAGTAIVPVGSTYEYVSNFSTVLELR